MSENKKMHALYSHTQELNSKETKYRKRDGSENKRNNRYVVYLRDNGEEVIVTEVSKNYDRVATHAENFSDSQYLGIVTKYKETVYW